MLQRLPFFVGQAYTHKSLPISAQQAINWFPETAEDEGTRAPISMLPTPGLKEQADTGAEPPIRGLFAFAENLYVVGQSKVFQVSIDTASVTEIGQITAGNTPVRMADNRNEIIFVDGANGWIFNVNTSLFTPITDPDFEPATTVAYLDGYFVLSQTNTDRFFISGLFDGLSYNALEFGVAESSSDLIVALFADHRDLLLFGEQTIEIWRNTGNADFPFEAIQSMTIEKGGIAAHSVARVNRQMYWLGDDKIVYTMSGYQLQRVSTFAIEQEIQKYADVSDARAMIYTQEGHHFYGLTFPSANATWFFDATTGLWHQRSSGVDGDIWRVNALAQSKGRIFGGDRESGKVFELDVKVYDDDGAELKRVRTTAPFHDHENGIYLSELKLVFEQGVGLNLGQGSDPQVALAWSDDFGRNYSIEHWKTIGKIGAFGIQIIWRRLGKFRDRVFKIEATDPVPWVLVDASAQFDEAVD